MDYPTCRTTPSELLIEQKNATDQQIGSVEVVVNFAPNEIFGLVGGLCGLLIKAGKDLKPLDYLLQLAGIAPIQTLKSQSHTNLDKREFSFDNFNLPNYNKCSTHASQS